MTQASTAVSRKRSRPARRAFWMKQLYQWHWVSAALCLVGMVLFSVTGITLNHAGEIEAKPTVTSAHAALPAPLLAEIRALAPTGKNPLPTALADWLHDRLDAEVAGRTGEWSADEIYVALPRPGGDAWLSIDLADGQVLYERTDRGWISYLNDLHKGRSTGIAWRWFIDVFAGACLVFSATGLFLLQFHAARRPFTWPAVGLGLAVPAAIAVVFIHL